MRQKWLKAVGKHGKQPASSSKKASTVTRKVAGTFDFQSDYFLCTKSVANSKSDGVRHVKTSTLYDSIHNAIDSRSLQDDWALAVFGRLQSISDLHAADALYHQSCYIRFVENLPHTPKKVKRGRPINDTSMGAFDLLCDELETESENEFFTLSELHDKMVLSCKQLGLSDYDLYTKDYLRTLLNKRYGDHIYFSSEHGREDVIGFKLL